MTAAKAIHDCVLPPSKDNLEIRAIIIDAMIAALQARGNKT
jgi:hypothetical protein